MSPEQWVVSARLSWGVFFKLDRYRNPRIDILKNCEIVGDCWVSSVGTTIMKNKRIGVQRAAYGLFVGVIRRGDVLLPLCGESRCCCPDHLHLVPRDSIVQAKENKALRGDSV